MKSVFASLGSKSAARVAAIRLALAWLPLSLVIGGAAWHYETERLEDRVLADAIHDSQQVKYADLDRYYRNEISLLGLHHEVKKVLGEFVSVEIYDTSKTEIVHELNERATLVPTDLWQRVEAVQLDNHPTYNRSYDSGLMTIITVVPIEDASKNINGYLKGIYLVPDETLAEMREDTAGAIVIALMSVLVTMLVVFPIILSLQRRDAKQTQRVLKGNMELLEVLGNAIAYRDSDTDSHNYRVTLYAVNLAEYIGLAEDRIRILVVGAFLHDIGKIGISDAILLKPGKLTEEEFETMKTHVTIGAEIVQRSGWLAQAIGVVACHHEKFDGRGYPNSLMGETIPFEARLFAIADVFDALTSLRPYKEPLSFSAAMSIMRKECGRHFDPEIFSRFEEIAAQLYNDIGEASYELLRATLLARVQKYLVAI